MFLLSIITILTTILSIVSVFPQFIKSYKENNYKVFSFSYIFQTQMMFFLWLVYAYKTDLKLLFFQMIGLFVSYVIYMLLKLNSENIKNKFLYILISLSMFLTFLLDLKTISIIAVLFSISGALTLLYSTIKNNTYKYISLSFISILSLNTFLYSIYGFITNDNTVMFNNIIAFVIFSSLMFLVIYNNNIKQKVLI